VADTKARKAAPRAQLPSKAARVSSVVAGTSSSRLVKISRNLSFRAALTSPGPQ
jgi:hypothetical protein